LKRIKVLVICLVSLIGLGFLDAARFAHSTMSDFDAHAVSAQQY